MIGYSSDTIKQLFTYSPKTQHILLLTNQYNDESKQETKLLMGYLLNFIYITSAKQKLTSELRPYGRPRKIVAVKKTLIIQRSQLQKVVKNTNTSLAPQRRTVENITVDLGSIENGNKN